MYIYVLYVYVYDHLHVHVRVCVWIRLSLDVGVCSCGGAKLPRIVISFDSYLYDIIPAGSYVQIHVSLSGKGTYQVAFQFPGRTLKKLCS